MYVIRPTCDKEEDLPVDGRSGRSQFMCLESTVRIQISKPTRERDFVSSLHIPTPINAGPFPPNPARNDHDAGEAAKRWCRHQKR